MSRKERVIEYIEGHREEIIAFMRRLVQTMSVTGDESEIGTLIAQELRRDGLDVELVEPALGRVSVVARHKGAAGGPRVMVYSHYDTVPAGDPDSWTYPPFSATVADGQIWGRGTADNKLATCAATMAYRAMRELGVSLRGGDHLHSRHRRGEGRPLRL
jgi:acetylornithine deacetylase